MPADKVSKTSNRFVPYDLGRRPLHAPVGHSGGKVVRQANNVDLSQYHLCNGHEQADGVVARSSLAGRCLSQEQYDSQTDIDPQNGFLLQSNSSMVEGQCNTNGTVSSIPLGFDHGGYGYLCNENLVPYCSSGDGCPPITQQTFQDICLASANTCNISPTISDSLTPITPNISTPSPSPTAVAGMSVAFPVALAVGITVVVVAAGITTTVIIYKRIRDKIMGSADVTHDVIQWSTTGGTHIVDNRITEEADKVANVLKNSGSLASQEPNNDLDAPQYAVIDGQHITFKNLDSKEETV